jgi:hypothetical protein
MKGTAGKAKAWFTGAKLTKVFTRLGDDIGSQFHDDTSSRLATNGHVKVALGIGPKWMISINVRHWQTRGFARPKTRTRRANETVDKREL